MLEELSLRISRALSHLGTIESKSSLVLNEIDDYVSLHERDLLDSVLKRILNVEDGEYVEYPSLEEVSKAIPSSLHFRSSYPSKELYSMVGAIKNTYHTYKATAMSLKGVLENYLDGLKYVTSLTSVPEELLAHLRNAENLSMMDFEGVEVSLERYLEKMYLVFPRVFSHNGKYYVFTPDHPVVKEEIALEKVPATDKGVKWELDSSIIAFILGFLIIVSMILVASV